MTPIQVHHDWRDIPEAARGCVAALGNFDGVHLGHAHLIHALHTARPDAPLAVVTFDPHPREVFRPEDPPFRLTLPEMRDAALMRLGVRHVFSLRFDRAFSRLSAEAFVADLLHEALGVRHVACGADFAFGHRRSGDVGVLERLLEPCGIGLTVVPALSDSGGPLASTRIRRLLQDGYPERAAEELGRPWAIRGPVIHGDQRGRTLGFPTANVPLGRHLEPMRGVYAVRVRLPSGAVHDGVANLGRRPTVADGRESRLEAHLFDFAGDLYGQMVEVEFHALLREEKRFESFDALTRQIALDVVQARACLGSKTHARMS